MLESGMICLIKTSNEEVTLTSKTILSFANKTKVNAWTCRRIKDNRMVVVAESLLNLKTLLN